MVNSINTNIAAYSAQRNIAIASNNASSSIARLSSGNRIVHASDDVAALAAGTSLSTQVGALRTAQLNAAQGSSLLQVADGALSQITDILQRQKAIAIQAGSGSLDDTDRSFLNQEFQGLSTQIDQITSSTNFNGVTLLNGGLGTKTSLANTDALAALLKPSTGTGSDAGYSADATKAIQGYNITTGALLQFATGAGGVDVVDSAGTQLTNGAFSSVNSSVYGQFSNFRVSNVVYGTSATISADLNGVTFSGTYASGTTITLSNGTTNLKLKATAAISLTNAGTVNAGVAALADDFKNTVIQRVSTVNGVDFSGTRLQGVTGSTTAGIAVARLIDGSHADITNFRYLGNLGTADSSILAVDINGSTFRSTNVVDALAGGNVLVFEDDKGQALQIDLTGLDTDFTDVSGTVGNDQKQHVDLVNALNAGFSKAGGGLNFAVGAQASDNVRVQLNSASTNTLFGGQSLSVSSADDAQTASDALTKAINSATSIRSNVGALQSRFNFISANLDSSIQNEDAARGTLLDTDVAAESTSYATSQVQLQAGIAVLAQANLLPQNLLKLIG